MLHPPLKYFIPAIVWFFTTLYLFTIPGKQLPSAEWFNIVYADKWVHMGLFGVLQLVCCWPYTKSNLTPIQQRNTFVVVALLAVFYGIAIEFAQKYYIPNRSFDGFDIVADSFGACTACVLYIRQVVK